MKIVNYPYRQGIVAYIFDEDKNFLLLQLPSYKETEWAFLGGGREENETELDNLFREIKEEIGLDREDFLLIGRSKEVYKYDFPSGYSISHPEAKFRGQIKVQFLLKLITDKSKIKIKDDEIKAFKWVNIQDISKYLIFSGQYEQFSNLIDEFSYIFKQ